MKKLAIGLVMAALGSTAASAQGVEFRLNTGPDRAYERPRERVIVRERRAFDEPDVVVRRRSRDVDVTGSTNCRTVVVRQENEDGDMVTRRTRRCD